MYRYPDAKIYEIRCYNTGLCYIGSTNKTLEERLKKHKNAFDYFILTGKKKVSSYDVIVGSNYKIHLLENFPVDDLQELRDREGQWIRKIPCTNHRIPGRTKEEYNKGYRKMYYEKNIEKFKEINKQVAQIDVTCECGTTVRYKHIARHRKSAKHLKLIAGPMMI